MRRQQARDTDQHELLSRLSTTPIDVVCFLMDLGWSAERFEVAITQVRKLGIKVQRHAGNAIAVGVAGFRLAVELADAHDREQEIQAARASGGRTACRSAAA